MEKKEGFQNIAVKNEDCKTSIEGGSCFEHLAVPFNSDLIGDSEHVSGISMRKEPQDEIQSMPEDCTRVTVKSEMLNPPSDNIKKLLPQDAAAIVKLESPTLEVDNLTLEVDNHEPNVFLHSCSAFEIKNAVMSNSKADSTNLSMDVCGFFVRPVKIKSDEKIVPIGLHKNINTFHNSIKSELPEDTQVINGHEATTLGPGVASTKPVTKKKNRKTNKCAKDISTCLKKPGIRVRWKRLKSDKPKKNLREECFKTEEFDGNSQVRSTNNFKSKEHQLPKCYICTVCSAAFTRPGRLKIHIRYHTGEKPFPCSLCSATFAAAYNLKKHLQTHTTVRLFKCLECPAAFKTSCTLRAHKRTHLSERRFECHCCHVKFRTSGALGVHMRIHTKERPYKCTHCPATFRQVAGMRTHLRIHTGEKPFKCEECSKRFSTKNALQVHNLVHTQAKPYQCDECSRAFSLPSRLRQHKRTHTGVKPFTCYECNASFKHKSGLLSHARLYRGERPYSCTQCSKSFVDASHLSRHLKVHSGEKKYTCPQCPAKFSRSWTLKLHIQETNLSSVLSALLSLPLQLV